MSDYLRVLDSAEQHLLALKASGVRFLSVESNTMTALTETPVRSPAAVSPLSQTPTPPTKPRAAVNGNEATISPPRANSSVMLSYDSMDITGGMDELRQRAMACLKCPHLVKSR